jgi:hypothetical protein
MRGRSNLLANREYSVKVLAKGLLRHYFNIDFCLALDFSPYKAFYASQ